MDYAVARADDLPLFVTECDESQPCTHNPLGAKGCGEAGSIGAPAAVVSAALDALAGLGVTDLEMPITSEQIWRRIGEARGEAFVIPGRCQGNDVGYHLAKRCGCRCYSRRAAACCEARRLRRLGEQ